MAGFLLILSHIGLSTMAAEAPNPHHGGPGRMEGGINGLSVVNVVGHIRG